MMIIEKFIVNLRRFSRKIRNNKNTRK